MFDGSPLAVKKYGTRERAERITAESATEAYRDILRRAAVEILFIGCGDPSAAEKCFPHGLLEYSAAPVTYDASLPCVSSKEVRTVREDMDIAQGKLVMGFRTGETSVTGCGQRHENDGGPVRRYAVFPSVSKCAGKAFPVLLLRRPV